MEELLDQATISNFENAKSQCLGKRDKSSAGRLDPGVVQICGRLNEYPEFYTTSSCAGRCFLYTGEGIKSTDTFQRFRVSHESIKDPDRYFDLTTLESDPTGGGDHIKEFDGGRKQRLLQDERNDTSRPSSKVSNPAVLWLRFEPFILHVACRTLSDASKLMDVVRPVFKNVGLTTFHEKRFLVAIWGDEGLDMPLTDSCGENLVNVFTPQWLAQLVNDRHHRNAAKIVRLVHALQSMPVSIRIPKSFDVVGDVAIVHSVDSSDDLSFPEIGRLILNKNKAIKVVAVRTSNLNGSERAAGETGFQIIAGQQRKPLVTTHREYGISCVVNLQDTFFSPRMGPERLRICQQTARNEHVLVLFAGVCMDALQLAARTEADITAIELNPVAVECARNSHRMLKNNKKGVKCHGAAERLLIMEGDCFTLLPTLPKNYFDRIVVPRPKEGSLDGNQPQQTDHAGGGDFLHALLVNLKRDGGEVHWYDFCSDHEFPACARTVQLIRTICDAHGLNVEILHTANAGSVAKRQQRVCVDFRVSPR